MQIMLTKYCHGELHGADKLEFCFQESVAEARQTEG